MIVLQVNETIAQLREVTIERDNYYERTAKVRIIAKLQNRLTFRYNGFCLLQLKEKCSRQKSKLSTLREEIIELEVI